MVSWRVIVVQATVSVETSVSSIRASPTLVTMELNARRATVYRQCVIAAQLTALPENFVILIHAKHLTIHARTEASAPVSTDWPSATVPPQTIS